MSIEIEIYNAHSKITTKNQIIFDLCSDTLSYIMAGAAFATNHAPGGWDGSIKLMNKKGEFPTGLLPKLVMELRRKKIEYKLKDARKRPPKRHSFAFKGFPPRPYQSACAEMSDVRTRGVFEMGTGCLAGDTVININRAKKGSTITLKDLYTRFTDQYKGVARQWDLVIPTKVRSFDGENMSLNLVEDVVESGIKKVFLLTLENGKRIKATACHQIMTKRGWVRMDALTPADEIMVDVLNPIKKCIPKKNHYKMFKGLKHHPYCCGTVAKARGRLYRVPVHRLAYEANLNGVELNEFLHLCRTQDMMDFKFVNPKIYAIHHKDHDHTNNAFSNLEKLTHVEHLKLHSKDSYKNFNTQPSFSALKSVTELESEMTYDICCKAPHHNFVANGIVVHNSGKTYTAALITKRQGVDTLIITPDTGLREQLTKEFKSWFDPKVISNKIASDAPIVVANIQSIMNSDSKLFLRFQCIIIDEFHHCFSPDTKINLGKERKLVDIKSIYEQFHTPTLHGQLRKIFVKSWDGTDWVPKQVINALKYPAPKKMLKVKVQDEDGNIKEFIVTKNHKFLTDHGRLEIGEMKVGDELVLGYKTHGEKMRTRSQSPEYKKYLSEKIIKFNENRTKSSIKRQSTSMKKRVKDGTINPFGRGVYGNGGILTPTQKEVVELLDGQAELSVTVGDGQRPYHYKIDVAIESHKIGIEIDGSSHKYRKEIDERKDSRLGGLGWEIVRIPESCSREELLALKKSILQMITSMT